MDDVEKTREHNRSELERVAVRCVDPEDSNAATRDHADGRRATLTVSVQRDVRFRNGERQHDYGASMHLPYNTIANGLTRAQWEAFKRIGDRAWQEWDAMRAGGDE